MRLPYDDQLHPCQDAKAVNCRPLMTTGDRGPAGGHGGGPLGAVAGTVRAPRSIRTSTARMYLCSSASIKQLGEGAGVGVPVELTDPPGPARSRERVDRVTDDSRFDGLGGLRASSDAAAELLEGRGVKRQI